jgi:hypothetical protein
MGKQLAAACFRKSCGRLFTSVLGIRHRLRPMDWLHDASRVSMPRGLSLSVLAAMLAAYALIPVSSAWEQVSPAPAVPFKAHVDMQTFMEHVLTPAARIVWRVNGTIIDKDGEHDLSPRSEADWEEVVSGAATLAEATNALMIPERVRDGQWNSYALKLVGAASEAYKAAEAQDLKAISEVSDRLDGICAACHRHYGIE